MRDRVPYMTSTLMERADRRVVDLTPLGFPEIPVLGMNRVTRTGTTAALHRHRDCFEITFCLRGGAKFDCNDRVCALKPGMVFITTAKDAHRLRENEKGTRLYWMFLRVPKSRKAVLGLPSSESLDLLARLSELARCPFLVGEEVRRAFGEMFAAYDDVDSPPSVRSFRMRVAALRLLSAIAYGSDGADGARRDGPLVSIIEEMRRHPEGEYGTAWLVNRTHLSPNTILARFRRLTGLPPHAFLVKCRIRKAKELLRRKARTVTRVAFELGFASSQHFSFVFSQETGMSPSAWVSVQKNAK